ncbi:hypothetical protein RND71_030456 [Anisodus tanguticus]|uniref:Cyclic nucleotide-binding domain-containing protein n=1 Tax=Anisodus tanguticus TaxID=243964 RepID=A0AAE1UZQ1_9SOLA|nr:hypothetical protein RND71_030456 [Anisodus tanguticus]
MADTLTAFSYGTQSILIWAVYSGDFGFFRGLPENLFLLDIAGQIAFLIDIVVLFFVTYRDAHFYCMVYDRKLIVIRLSRALRVIEFFEKLEKDIRLNYLFTRIIKLFVVELYCTHTAACIFYYLATTLPPWEEGYTWIGSLKMGDYNYAHFRDIDLWTRYITSLYFAVVTMATVGSNSHSVEDIEKFRWNKKWLYVDCYGEIHAVNVREMIFVMIYVSFDMILGAYLLGNMAALIVKGSKTERFRDKMADLIKYMNRNRLGKSISKEIKDHVRLQYESRYNESSVLQDIPVSIRAKMAKSSIRNKLHYSVIAQLSSSCGHEEWEELTKSEENETEEPLLDLQTYNSVGEISVLCNIRVPYTVQVSELSRLLRYDKQALMEILGVHFSDGRMIINNLLERWRDEWSHAASVSS